MDFEYERKFYVRQMPPEALAEPLPQLIVQAYYLACDGYGLRVRVKAAGVKVSRDTKPSDEVLSCFEQQFDFASITVKGPYTGGTRYEAEREIDVNVALGMIRRGGKRLIKNRYSVWLGHDGWAIDEFAGDNYPLMMAECERDNPVTNLEIPRFCVSEVTDDQRFTNDSLAAEPFSGWAEEYEREITLNGGRFLKNFGTNRHL